MHECDHSQNIKHSPVHTVKTLERFSFLKFTVQLLYMCVFSMLLFRAICKTKNPTNETSLAENWKYNQPTNIQQVHMKYSLHFFFHHKLSDKMKINLLSFCFTVGDYKSTTYITRRNEINTSIDFFPLGVYEPSKEFLWFPERFTGTVELINNWSISFPRTFRCSLDRKI